MVKEIERLTSREYERRVFQPEPWILLCGVCKKPIRTPPNDPYFLLDAGVEHARYGRCHESCYLRKVTPKQRAEYLSAKRHVRRAMKRGDFVF